MDLSVLSYVFGIFSLIFYSIVYLPQFILIYRTKNSEDLSILMLILWSQADALSLMGVILLQLEINLMVIGWYHLFVGILMMLFTFYYRKKYRIGDGVSIGIFITTNIVTCSVLQNLITEPLLQPGEILGWITACLYIIGRFPQIYLNFKTKSVESLSVLMYVYTILGNLFYICSIVTFSSDYEYIRVNMPWIVLGIVIIVLDIFIIIQCKYYSKIYKEQREIQNVITDF